MKLQQKEIAGLEQQYRTTFINSLAGFRQAVLIGTISPKDQTNLAIFNSLIHLGANPALFGLIFRPNAMQRDTLKNILATGVYTLNYVASLDFAKAHQTSARYGTEISEFKEVGFSVEQTTFTKAPFVKEAVVKIAMKYEDKIDIPINGTSLVIGSIQHVELDEIILGPDGFVDLEQAGTLVTSGLDAYYKTQFIGRLSYAKPDKRSTLL